MIVIWVFALLSVQLAATSELDKILKYIKDDEVINDVKSELQEKADPIFGIFGGGSRNTAARGVTGVQACQGRGYNAFQCANVGCCLWKIGIPFITAAQCVSRVGNGLCQESCSGALYNAFQCNAKRCCRWNLGFLGIGASCVSNGACNRPVPVPPPVDPCKNNGGCGAYGECIKTSGGGHTCKCTKPGYEFNGETCHEDLVIDGTCPVVLSKLDCMIAASKREISDFKELDNDKYPPGCYFRRDLDKAFWNKKSSSKSPCTYQRECLCKKK